MRQGRHDRHYCCYSSRHQYLDRSNHDTSSPKAGDSFWCCTSKCCCSTTLSKLHPRWIVPHSLLLTTMVLSMLIPQTKAYFEQCSEELGGGLCPKGATCCPLDPSVRGSSTDGESGISSSAGSACIPTVLGNYNGTCCSLSTNSFKDVTGCAVGYTCEVNHPETGADYCLAGPTVTDELLQVLPRYNLCYQAMSDYYDDVFLLHGLPLGIESEIFPYYSSHGSLTDPLNQERLNQIEYAVVVMHGALRNADDMYCSVLASIYGQSIDDHGMDKNKVLLVAPRFSVRTDPDSSSTVVDPGEVIQWDGNDGGFGGSWRFGANAVWPPYAIHISSYDAFDAVVKRIMDCSPNLRHISVIGHSAGGQFVQRWSLLTSVWVNEKMSSVVANPSSYAYLTHKRRVHETDPWSIPDPTSECSGNYDKWMWGLQHDFSYYDYNINKNRSYSVDYVQRTIYGPGIPAILERFRSRHVIYLGASLDHCTFTKRDGPDAPCNSHGLQVTCADNWQGLNRLERHWNYYHSLQDVVYTGRTFNQQRDIVDGVGHDYSLIFNSPTGRRAVFHPTSYNNNISSHNDGKGIEKQQQQQQQQQQQIRTSKTDEHFLTRIFTNANDIIPLKDSIRDIPMFRNP